MNLAEALGFVGEHHRAVLATRRQDGRPQLSPVLATTDSEARAIISSRETARKVLNLRRDPRASLCVFTEGFFGAWVQLDGRAEILSLPGAMEPLVDYYRRAAGEHPDWDTYRSRMQSERRVLIRLLVEQAGPNQSG